MGQGEFGIHLLGNQVTGESDIDIQEETYELHRFEDKPNICFYEDFDTKSLLPISMPIMQDYNIFKKCMHCQKDNIFSPMATCNLTSIWSAMEYVFADESYTTKNPIIPLLANMAKKRKAYSKNGSLATIKNSTAALSYPDYLKYMLVIHSLDKDSINQVAMSIIANRFLSKDLKSKLLEEKWIIARPMAKIKDIIQSVMNGLPVIISCRPYAYAKNGSHKVILVGVGWKNTKRNENGGYLHQIPNYFYFADPFGSFVNSNYTGKVMVIPAWCFYNRFGINKDESGWNKTSHLFVPGAPGVKGVLADAYKGDILPSGTKYGDEGPKTNTWLIKQYWDDNVIKNRLKLPGTKEYLTAMGFNIPDK